MLLSLAGPPAGAAYDRGMLPRGVPDGPDGLDAGTSERILRTFVVVRLVRGSVLLLFLLIALVGAVARGWPSGLLVALGFAALAQAGALVVWCRRYHRAGVRPVR